MPFPDGGIYNIKNVATGTYLSVQGTAVGTPIVGYQNDCRTSANFWQVSVDTGTGICTFQTTVNGTFIQTKDGSVSTGTPLVTGVLPVEYLLLSNGNDEYRIHLANVTPWTDMVFYLANPTNYSPVILEVTDDASTNQLWTFLEDC